MIHQHLSSLVLLLSLASISLCFDTIYGSISAQDAMMWIQQNQPAADGGDAAVRWFWNLDDAKIDPRRKAAANPVHDIHTPWLDPANAGSCQIAAVNLRPVGVQTTWTQIKMAVLSILSTKMDPNSEETVPGGIDIQSSVQGLPTPPSNHPHLQGSLAIVIYNSTSQFAKDLTTATTPPSGLNPASFNNDIPLPPHLLPQPQDQFPPTFPIGPPPLTLPVPTSPPPGSIDCSSSSTCPVAETCQVIKNADGSSTQGCIPTVSAMLGLAYTLATALCIASPHLCALASPPSTLPPPFLCACNCTFAATACCTAADGMVAAEAGGQKTMLSPLGGMCCDELTGEFETTPAGEDNLDDGGAFAKCRNEPLIGADNIGRIQTRGRRGRGW
ncbi:MAG: hypothetical protein Q9195_003031 [Heterodermia aff. obscurata]